MCACELCFILRQFSFRFFNKYLNSHTQCCGCMYWRDFIFCFVLYSIRSFSFGDVCCFLNNILHEHCQSGWRAKCLSLTDNSIQFNLKCERSLVSVIFIDYLHFNFFFSLLYLAKFTFDRNVSVQFKFIRFIGGIISITR